MTLCRVCQHSLGSPVYAAAAPALTSLAATLDVPTRVFVCTACGHCQSDDLPAAERFYDTTYRIALDSADHDQVYAVVDGRPLYRTDHEVEVVLSHVSLADGALILDYGAGKAMTLRKIVDRRPNLVPHVFDVSTDYTGHWKDWIVADRCATYSLPDSWTAHFDVVTAHFVLEHVHDPVAVLRDIRRLLKDGGTLFLSVPDPIANVGDLIVVDHVNHFSIASLKYCLAIAGFGDVRLDRDAFAGAFVAVTRTGTADCDKQRDAASAAQALANLGQFWLEAGVRLDTAARLRNGRSSAIYGAGVYGSFIATRIGKVIDLSCFVDRNPHVRARPHMGWPVVGPQDLPKHVETIYAGLNPAVAPAILADVPEWRDRTIEVIYLA
jgi:SAM-dependent methyltransferase